MSCDDDNEQTNDTPDISRRDFLRGCLALPFVVAPLFVPSPLWAANSVKKLVPPKKAKAESKTKPETKPTKTARLIILDPGHGGHDPGAIGVTGTKEKNVTLDIARQMAELLSRQTGIRVRLTRENDDFLPLGERVKIGQASRADMFLSIHADSAPNPVARGLSAYTLSEKASDQFASMLAERENSADKYGGLNLPTQDKDVAEILFDLAARRTRNTAQRVKVGFIKGIGRRWQLLEEPMRAANFAVLRSPEVPAMLVETGFLSNRKDEKLLSTPKSRKEIAVLMAEELAFLLKSPLFG